MESSVTAFFWAAFSSSHVVCSSGIPGGHLSQYSPGTSSPRLLEVNQGWQGAAIFRVVLAGAMLGVEVHMSSIGQG